MVPATITATCSGYCCYSLEAVHALRQAPHSLHRIVAAPITTASAAASPPC